MQCKGNGRKPGPAHGPRALQAADLRPRGPARLPAQYFCRCLGWPKGKSPDADLTCPAYTRRSPKRRARPAGLLFRRASQPRFGKLYLALLHLQHCTVGSRRIPLHAHSQRVIDNQFVAFRRGPAILHTRPASPRMKRRKKGPVPKHSNCDMMRGI